MNKGDEAKKIKLLLEDLSSLEDYIHDFFSFSPLPICFISPLGVILEANPAFLKISGFDSGGVIGEPVENLFEDKEIEKVTQETLNKDVVAGREIKFFPKDGNDLICHVFTKARRDEENRPVGYFLGLFDLTETKKNERELRQTQSALLNILEDTEEAYRAAEAEKEKTILGTDPRRRQLVESFIKAKHNPRRFHSALFQDTSTRAQELLHSDKEEDSQPLLECLKELRVLLEEHVHTDAMQILGEI